MAAMPPTRITKCVGTGGRLHYEWPSQSDGSVQLGSQARQLDTMRPRYPELASCPKMAPVVSASSAVRRSLSGDRHFRRVRAACAPIRRAQRRRRRAPKRRQAIAFAWDAAPRVALAYYWDDKPGWDKTRKNGVDIITVGRTPAIEAMLHSFQVGFAELPSGARQVGGRMEGGLGEYYREMLALIQRLDPDAQGNWVSRYDDQGKADRYAHAETYCQIAIEWGER